ncbi:MAG: hypothetical protein R3E87_05055 [Burkholderiaceae bacterium]
MKRNSPGEHPRSTAADPTEADPAKADPGKAHPENRKVPATDTLDDEQAVRQSPPGTATGRNTTRPELSDAEPSDAHRATGERARQDAESEQENTDRYDTSGQDAAPPKTPYRR